jgi:hypothetical protein
MVAGRAVRTQLHDATRDYTPVVGVKNNLRRVRGAATIPYLAAT